MKKITLFFLFFLFNFLGYAQFSVTTNFGAIKDGDVFNFEDVEQSSAMRYKIYNHADEPINIRIKVLSINNSDGADFDLCLGGETNCYSELTVGQTYPINTYITIGPNETHTPDTDVLWNRRKKGENPEEGISYAFEFQQVDSAHTPEQVLQFTYRYTPKLMGGPNDLDVHIQSTMINNGKLEINAEQAVHVQIYNLLGRMVKTTDLRSGFNSLDVSGLSSQVYLVRFQGKRGLTKAQKIVVE